MLTSLALILLCGLAAMAVFKRLHMPYIIGMLLAGILLGPACFNVLDASTLLISADLRKMALIIILLKAGLSLDLDVLRRVGRPAVLLCFLPASLEIAAFLLFAPRLLGVSLVEAGVMGAVMGAVSPAVVVPRMSKLMDERRGTAKGIPQMIVAGSSADDVFVIVVFTALTSLAGGGSVRAADFLQIPVSILLGIALGVGVGWGLAVLFRRFHMRDTVKGVLLLSVAFLMVALESALSGLVPVSGLLAVMAMGVTLRGKCTVMAKRMTGKFAKLWVPAEILLFVLVGAIVDVRYALHAGGGMLVMLFLGLTFRLFGTWLCLIKTPLNRKEKLFCLLSQLPKATVQAAIGGVPLAMGLACGDAVLALAVISILITAPLGAIAIDAGAPRLLTQEK